MVGIFLPADCGPIIGADIALLPLPQAGLHLHHLHIVPVQAGVTPKVENVPVVIRTAKGGY